MIFCYSYKYHLIFAEVDEYYYSEYDYNYDGEDGDYYYEEEYESSSGNGGFPLTSKLAG